MEEAEDEVLTIGAAAKELNVTVRTVERWVASGKIRPSNDLSKGVRDRRPRIKIDRSEIERLRRETT